MDDDQQFCLRWNNHQSTLISVFDTLLENETLVDCTLAAEGKFLKAHKVVLSACSPYFATLLQEQYDKHPIFILKDVKYQELRAMMDYMYRGEVNISQDQLAALLKAAESLQIKGLSDNRTGGGSAPKPESSGQQHHRGGKLSGAYTLEQTKRARLATGGAMDASGDVSGSREGSSSPSRRRRKVRRRSMENDAHDNSNSSVLQAAASNQSILQQTGAGLAVSALVTTQLASGPAAGTSSQASSTQQQQPLTSTNVTKKTESAKLTSSTAAPASGASASAAAVQQAHLQQAQATSDAINTENVQAQSQGGAQGVQGDDDDMDEGSVIGGSSAASGPNPASASASAVHAGVVVKQLASVVDKSSSNHKQKIKDNSVSSVGSDMVIEPKAEYDDDAHDENVEDLTLDEEDMTMEELDQTAGTSQGGEGSSQTYAWQHDRSQDELGLMAQDAQQRDPQASKQDKGEQTEGTQDEFELDDCLLESNDIVITQNKDGFVLHVKKLGNITAAKLDENQSVQQQTQAAVTVTGPAGQPTPTITELLNAAAASHSEPKPTLTTLTSTPIKLPSSECELINIKKIIPTTTTIATHHPHTSSTIIHPHHIIQHVSQEQHHQEHHQQHQTIHIEEVPQTSQQHHHQQQHQQQQQQQHHHHQLQTAQPTHTQVQSIITAHPGQTINLVGLRNVQLTDSKPIASRIRYSRGKIIGPTVQNLQIVETHEPIQHQHHELADGTKYEISEIDLNNPNTSAAIISDLVKYAEIDDIELPDGTKIGIGFAPSEITEHMQTSGGETHITTIEHEPQELQTVHQHEQTQQTHHIHTGQLQTHHIQTVVQSSSSQQQQQQHDQQQQHHHHQSIDLQDDDGVETILPEELGIHDSSKSYTILTTRPMKEESEHDPSGMTYELSLSDSSLGPCDDPESRYVCRHCGKKYRWKSTLRRHENVECGGKEPCHPCPYCSYKAKQRGNLGVHVRKHHPEKPQLESKRGRKI
ncbi:longitudinals lacking protein, isoforms F/I/K/T isoform X1 [Drosophila eugracilis]|uniref:longitudinals lacking protein, isoforms F/I/K/T isoform X1 n=1 Tax=Drosophila eugracilis TaxID=29029 RepID=UPI0007E882A2|nr:longitudinals lacking protein, isoforms F/I/K/T isoform X1 [Drosophila eugracilis]XP_017077406.1 longitudinals lacking protein, isoforms F/I/K/T isoform X1 [Drosophila eugracilis]XP_017077407.1 longitudinals lacking protein, isoforms F/I/K/T isoform X1 [Drosophila eugracilis]